MVVFSHHCIRASHRCSPDSGSGENNPLLLGRVEKIILEKIVDIGKGIIADIFVDNLPQ